MRLKPKSTVKNPKALVYKRFIGHKKSINLATVYYTIYDQKYWTFDCDTLTFSLLDSSLVPSLEAINRIVVGTYEIVVYMGNYFKYINTAEIGETPIYQWTKIEDISENAPLLSATFNNIAKYQTNKYYFVGSFDYMIKGSVEGTTTQYIKGNIIPLTSLNIRYFCDDIELSEDDLVVIDKHLFSVENPSTNIKQMPKAFKIHFATLNSIL